MNPLRFTRRNLLRGGLAATAAIPLLDARRAERPGGDAIPSASSCSRRPTARATACSGRRAPRPTSRSTRSRPTSTPYKSKLTFLKGIKLNPSLQNGALGGTLGSEHARGTGGMLTGAAAQVGDAVQELRQHDVGVGQRPVARSVPGRQAGAEHDLHEPAARRARARHRGARPHLVRGRRHADPAARGSERRVRRAVRHAERRYGRRPTRRWRGCGRSARACSTRPTPRPTRIKNLVGADRPGQAGRAPGRDARRREAPGRHDRHRHDARRPHLHEADDARGRRPEERRPLPAGRPGADGSGGGGAGVRPDPHPHLPVVVLRERAPVRFLGLSGNHHVISHDFASSGANYDAYNKIQIWYQQQFAYLLQQDGRVQGRRQDAARQQHRAVGDRDRRVDPARPDDDAVRPGGQRGRQDPRRAACSTSAATAATTTRCWCRSARRWATP